jgi:hypothetical protein
MANPSGRLTKREAAYREWLRSDDEVSLSNVLEPDADEVLLGLLAKDRADPQIWVRAPPIPPVYNKLHESRPRPRPQHRPAALAVPQLEPQLEPQPRPPPPLPDYIVLLRIPAEQRSVAVKCAIAHHLERIFMARGSGPMLIQTSAVNYIASLTAEQLALAKYEWFMAYWSDLWRRFPPEPVL